jgi:DeoR/GlpR family transcriptional regulator of sugar metabolism
MLSSAPERQRFIQADANLAIDGGTTVACIADQILPENLTILTNSIFTAERFLRHPTKPTVYGCGGLLREASGTFIGKEALSFFSRRRVDRYFLSATGVDREAGITDLTLEDNEVKRAMAASSTEVILLVDQSKFTVRSHMEVLPWRRIDHLVTDAEPSLVNKVVPRASGPVVHRV